MDGKEMGGIFSAMHLKEAAPQWLGAVALLRECMTRHI